MTEIDLVRLQSEINAEVKKRRAAGDFPLGLERELDSMFARYAPAGTGDDFGEVMIQAETLSFVHADIPTASRIAPLVPVKKMLRKLMAWYMRFLAQQVTAFAGAITRAVRLLGQRVDTLESVTVLAGRRTLSEVRERRASPDLDDWTDLVVSETVGAPGRVLHAECGRGALLAAAIAAGADAYGVEPVDALATDAAGAGLDVRADDALAHLQALPSGALGGLILSGCVDALPLGEVLELADRAAAVVTSGGVVIVLSGGPSAWSDGLDPVIADLTPGRPLRPQTWSHLLGQRGFCTPRIVLASSGPPPLQEVPTTTDGASVINANVARLNQLLFSPGYAVIARQP